MAPGRHDRRNQIVLTLVGMLFAATSAQALSVTNEPTPWHLLDDESSLAVTIGLSDDERTGWSSNHAGLMFRLPTGERTRAYARWFHVVYDDAGVNASDRWPEIGVMEPVEVAIPDGELRQSDEVLLWNVLDRHVGWSRPEFGILGSMQWPLLGGLNYAASAWLPFASNELYPYAARSISGRIALRKELDLGPAFTLAFDGFLTRDMAPGGDLLTEDAMVGWSGGGGSPRESGWNLEARGWTVRRFEQSDGAGAAPDRSWAEPRRRATVPLVPGTSSRRRSGSPVRNSRARRLVPGPAGGRGVRG